MTHFEYISVAVSLIYSLILAKLLGALPAALRPSRRYWVHSLWIVILFFITCDSWWRFWTYRGVDWSPTAFVSLLAVPSIIYLRAAILLSNQPFEVISWREHYYITRRPFFLLQLLGMANYALSHWLISGEILVSTTQDLLGFALFGVLAIVAAIFTSPRLHEATAIMMLIAIIVGFFFQQP